VFKEVAHSIAGVTSLSLATVAVHAPQEAPLTTTTTLANAPSALMLLMRHHGNGLHITLQ